MPTKQPRRRRKAGKQPACASEHQTSSRLPAWKKVVFGATTCLLVLGLLEGALWLAGVRAAIVTADPYVGFASRIPLFVPQKEADGTIVMATAENKLAWFNPQEFPKQKGPDTFRVFCLGGSTTYGRPYDDATSFCGWLREFLRAADTDHHWEVINAGGISYASYRVALVLEELVQYEPDVVIVYTGHNEFLEHRSYDSIRRTPPLLRQAGAVLSRTRTFSAMRTLLNRGEAGDVPRSATDLLPGEVATRLDKGVGPAAFDRDDVLREQILEHFRFNLARIVDLARDAGAEIMFVTPASNLRNCTPFKSQLRENVTGADEARLHQLLESAKESLAAQDGTAALKDIDAALAIDDRYAEAHFLRGRSLEQLERHAEARAAFLRARDEDVCPLRAMTPIRDLVLEVADRKRVPVVDFEKMAAQGSANQIPGDNLFLDHVHPTIEGHRLLSLAILETMIDRQLVAPSPKWGTEVIEQVTNAVGGRVDRQAQGDALRNLAKVFAWAGKHEEANRMALQAAELISTDSDALYLAANALIAKGEYSSAIAQLQQSISLNPNHAQSYCSLGVAYQQQGRLEMAEEQYQRALQIDSQNASAHNNLGALYVGSGQWQRAAEHLERAVSLNPRHAKAHHNLGALYAKQKDRPQALEHLLTAVAIDPSSAEAHQDLGKLYAAEGKMDRAVFHYRRAVQLEPQLLMTANALAWLLATSPNANVRDGKEAVRWALHCAEATGYGQPGALNTLAAAYAEAGDFAQATKWQSRALEMAPESLRDGCQQRLALYQSGRPYRVPDPAANDPAP